MIPTTLLSATLLLASTVRALNLHTPVGSPQVVSFPFEKVDKNPQKIPYRFRNRKRASTVLQRLDNADYLYYCNITIGTPPQRLRVHIDTGSSDLWVESPDSKLCQDPSNPCATSGTYDRDKSSTYKFVSNDFEIQYADKEYARGDYGNETIQIGGVKLTDLQFGIGLDTTASEGIMGIGYDTNEVQVGWLGRDPYPNIVNLMVSQGHIKSRAYSLWLNDFDASHGEILFGGIDTAKYSGELFTVPINLRRGQTRPSEFMITLTTLGLTNENGDQKTLTDKTFRTAVLLDSGTTFSYLPPSTFETLAAELGVQYIQGYAVMKCGLQDYKGSVDFGFSGSGFQIHVPFNELVIPGFDQYGEQIYFNNGEPLCFFGIFPTQSKDSTYVLGDTFLRSAYVVYDLDNAEISLANVHFNVTESKILEIGKGPNAVPQATGVENPVTVEYTATGRPRGTGNPTGISEPSSTARPGNNGNNGNNDKNAAPRFASSVMGAVGVAVGAWVFGWMV